MRDGTFLQSPSWEHFQQQVGLITSRVGDVLVIEHATPLGSYWYIGRANLDGTQIDAVAQQAKQAGMLFVRIDPLVELLTTHYSLQPTLATQPQTTLVLDLAPSLDVLLSSFHEKTRYNIRLAERKGVTIEESSDPNGKVMDDFLMLMAKTGSRQGIRAHSEGYYRRMLESLNQRNPSQSPFSEREKNQMPPSLGKEGLGEISASIVAAYHGDQPLAANLMIWAGETAYYLHGASDHAQRQLMAPHLLQWACIQRAKERGAQQYDFWGIAPPLAGGAGNYNLQPTTYNLDASHPWSGITRFKLGFGGAVTTYPQSVDVVLDPFRYRVYQVGRTLRRFLGRVV